MNELILYANELILYAGLGIAFFGTVGMIMTAFRTSLPWGLGVVLLPPVVIVYLMSHWQEAKGPFKIQIVGLLIIGAFAYMNGGISAVTAVSSNISTNKLIEPERPISPPSVLVQPAPPVALPPPTHIQPRARVNPPVRTVASTPVASVSQPAFKCDGRQHCSQMKSCAEATYFLKNCPNTQMDGDNNGIPCERQWCKAK